MRSKLTHTFNYMANSLRNTVEISSEKSKMEAIELHDRRVIAFNMKGSYSSNPRLPTSWALKAIENSLICAVSVLTSLENVQYFNRSSQPR